MIDPAILTVPTLLGSGEGHWQRLSERERRDTHRIDLRDRRGLSRTGRTADGSLRGRI